MIRLPKFLSGLKPKPSRAGLVCVLNLAYPWVLILILAIPAIWSLSRPGFFSSHDGDWMVVRLSAFHQSFSDGQIPVRWTQRLNNNFGYPVLNFLYPLPFYLAEPLVLAGIGLVNSVKLIFLVSLVGSALAMFIWLKRQTDSWPALAGALLYLYTPYRFVDTYVRGSLGEALGFLFLPLVFLGIDLIFTGASIYRGAFLALALAALVLAHNVFGLIFGGLAGLYLLFWYLKTKNFSRLLWGLAALGWGLALTAFFWFPALTETKFTRFPETTVADFRDHFPTLAQLIYSKWGYGFSVTGPQDEIAFQVGLANFLAVFLAGVLAWKNRSKRSIFFLSAFGVGFFLMLPLTGRVWEISRVLPLIQFPWRLLALTTFTSAAALGLAFTRKGSWPTRIGCGLVVILALYANRNHLRPNTQTFWPDSYYATNEATTTVSDEYLPKWAKTRLPQRANLPVELMAGQGKVAITEAKTGRISWLTKSDEPLKIRINALYYPGWTYRLDGQLTKPVLESLGTPVFEIPVGSHQGQAFFGETNSRLAADLISGLASILVIVIFLKVRPSLFGPLLVVLLSLGTVVPLFHSGWIPIHDDTQIARVFEMAQGLSQGQFPVRWVGDLGYGYGYPLFNYYAPLPYYFGGILVLAGLTPLLATKLMIAAAMILAGLGVWAFWRGKFGYQAALLGSALYLYIPFRAVELYVRGAVAELWGMAFLPWALVGVDLVFKAARGRFFLAPLLLAGLILSHNLTALMVWPVILGYAGLKLVQSKSPGRVIMRKFLAVLALALGISAFYWLPALTERNLIDTQRLIAGGGGDFRVHFLEPNQLWDSPWGFGGSTAGQPDGMSFKIGKLHLILALAALGLSLVAKNGRTRTLWFFAGVALAAGLMTLSVARPVWEILAPILAFWQYPWRFLALVSLAIALAGGALPYWLGKFWPLANRELSVGLVTGLLVALTVGVNQKYFQPQKRLDIPSQAMVAPQALRWQASRLSDEFLPPGFTIPETLAETAPGLVAAPVGVQVVIRQQSFTRIQLSLETKREAQVFLNVVNFPGWRLWLDGRPVNLIPDPSGRDRLGLILPSGTHLVAARFANTPIRTIADFGSALAIGFWLLGSVRSFLPGKLWDRSKS